MLFNPRGGNEFTMTVTHTKGVWWEYYPETNIAGGPSGAAYATTAPSGAAELTPCNYPFNEEQTMPMAEYIQEAVEAPGQDISQKVVFTKGMKIIPGKLSQYMQNSTWLDWALGIAPVGNGGGALPKTFLLHWDDGNVEYTAYGCYITEYKLSISKGEYVKEEVTFMAYDVQAEAVAADDPPFDETTAVANFEDVGTTTITIDGSAIVDLDNAAITITNSYTEGTPGSYYHKYPYLLKRDVEIEMEFLTYEGDHILDMLSETADPCTIVFTPLGKCNFEATLMKPKPESVNINVIPEKGMKSYKVTFEIGGKSVFTTPA